MRSLIVLFSYHHNNTRKIAEVMAKVLGAQIKSPQETSPEELNQYDLVGFGSGIYSYQHHTSLLDLADSLPQVTNRKAFIFSTTGEPATFGESAVTKALEQHTPLREKLQSKRYVIVDEFICAGFNTNKFLRWFGGINKGRPNAADLKHADEFARNLLRNHERPICGSERTIAEGNGENRLSLGAGQSILGNRRVCLARVETERCVLEYPG